MFTPQKKLWSPTLRSEPDQKNGSISGLGSGLNFNPTSPSNGGTAAKGKGLDFLPSDGIMDRDSLLERVSKLEKELFDYQYNMGLLLIEKQEWISKNEKLRQALADETDSLKSEQAAHMSAISEVKKWEENLKMALGVERQRVFDLEKSIREIDAKYSETKLDADLKLADAHALVSNIQEKSLEVEAKSHAADAKFAEASRRSSDIERKLLELKAQENALQSERSSFNAEREAHDASISNQREDLRRWDQELKVSQERLANGRRLLNQREERAKEKDKIWLQDQNAVEELRKEVEFAQSMLKNKEDDIENRLASLALREKEAEEVRKNLEFEKRRLLEWGDQLNDRERVEIEKLLDEHRRVHAEKQMEFEMELERKRKLLDEEFNDKFGEVRRKEAEVTHREEIVKKQAQAIEKKSEKVRQKKEESDSISKALMETAKSLEIEEKKLEKKRTQILAEKEDLLTVKAGNERFQAETEKKLLQLSEEQEQLKAIEHETIKFAREKAELKREIDIYRFQHEQLDKEADGLKEDKGKFEKEWEELDAKRAEIKKELEELLEQKKNFERLRHSEEEQLRNEKQEAHQSGQRLLDSLKLAKDTFAASMEHEKSVIAENMGMEKRQLHHDFELKNKKLVNAIQKKQEEMENHFHDREQLFEKERMKELDNINCLREVSNREMEESKLERRLVEKERLEISQSRKPVEKQQYEMEKDIEELAALTQKLKNQKQQLMKERECFTTFVEKQKGCSICGEMISNFVLSNPLTFTGLETLEAPPLPRVAENYLRERVEGTLERLNYESSPIVSDLGSPAAVRTFSWLRKCTSKILKLSPANKLVPGSAQDPGAASSVSMDQAEMALPQTLQNNENEPEPSLRVVNDSFDVQMIQSNSDIREAESIQTVSVDQGQADKPEISRNSDLDKKYHRTGRGGRSRPSRTRSVKAVIAGAKTILGESPEEIENQYANRTADNSAYTNEDSQAESDLGVTRKNRGKRNHGSISQVAVSDSLTEGHSDSVKDDDRPKRRQRVVATEQSLGKKRYNLRQTKRYVATAATPQVKKVKKKAPEGSLAIESRHPVNVDAGGVGDGAEGAFTRGVRSSISVFTADSPEKFENAMGTIGGHLGAVTASTNDLVLSEEVNGTETGVDYSGEDENHGEDDDDEQDHPGAVSVGKKIWTFFTT